MKKEELDIRLKEHAEKLLAEKSEREKRIKEHWEYLPKFNHPNDVPDLPNVEEKEWKEFYVPRLIGAGAIPKKDLVVDQIYVGAHRQARVAKWTGKEFVYNRTKFNWTYEDNCNHFEDDDGFALFVPLRLGTEEEYEKNGLIV